MTALQAPIPVYNDGDKTTITEITDHDTTFAANTTTATASGPSVKKTIKKKGAKPKLSAKEKKERNVSFPLVYKRHTHVLHGISVDSS